jgi:hypothetical protein
MKDKGIFGVPVVDPATKRPLAIINMFNFASFFLDNEAPKSDDEILCNRSTEDIMGRRRCCSLDSNIGYRVTNVLPVKQNNISFRKTCSLLTKSGCHSLSLMKNKKITHLITRASVIRFIAGTGG